MFCAKALVLTH